MKSSGLLLLALGFSSLLLVAATGAAQKEKEREKGKEKESVIEEADRRFTKGVELFKDGDYGAALSEFIWAYNLKPHYAVLYNIAVCYAKLERYVDAVEYYNQYLKEGGDKIPQSRLSTVKEELELLKSRIGRLMISTNVDHVSISVNGKEVAKTPLREPILVEAGLCKVELSLPGYMTIKDEVPVAGGETLSKNYVLLRDKRTAKVTVLSTAPNSRVYVNGREMGKCPWTGDLSIGEHEIKVVAPGYEESVRSIVVHPDEEREIEFEPRIAGKPGKLAITSEVQGAQVWVEQQEIGILPMKPHRLPAGTYHVSIAKEGYKGWEGEVAVKEGSLTKIDVQMDRVGSKLHPWGFSLATSIALAAAATAGVLGYFTIQKQEEFDTFPEKIKSGTEGGNMFKLQQKYDELAEEGRRLSAATDVALALAAVAGVTSIFLAFYTQFRQPGSKATISIGSNVAGGRKGPTISTGWSF